MARARDRRGGLLAARGAVLAGLLAVVALVAREGAVLVHSCLPGDGATGWLGVRLALLRADAECPAGTLALGGDSGQVMGVVVLVALPLLLTHLVGVGIGLGLLARLALVLHAARAVLAAVLPRLPGRTALLAPLAAVPPAAERTLAPVLQVLDAPRRRGPPALILG